ncbi:MAG: hypothetical protein PHX51_08620, partial [Clostridia bacterium]|nr:hypothetical protein [Clostridia bacterium]
MSDLYRIASKLCGSPTIAQVAKEALDTLISLARSNNSLLIAPQYIGVSFEFNGVEFVRKVSDLDTYGAYFINGVCDEYEKAMAK